MRALPAWKLRRDYKRASWGPRGPFIYRYLAFNPGDKLCAKKIRDLMVESVLYLAAPSDFDDPYDFRAYVALEDDPVKRRKYFESSARSRLRAGDDLLPDVHGKQRKLDALVAKAMHSSLSDPNFASRVFDRTRDRNGVACFSQDPRGLLLWAHYSGGHSGICLQFDVTKDPVFFMHALGVQYSDELAKMVWPRDKDDIVDKVILSKGRAWETEKEVRYVSTEVVRASLPFDGRALRAIILGSRFPPRYDKDIDQIIQDRVRRGLPAPIVYQAHQKKMTYGICLKRRSSFERSKVK